MLSIDPAGIIDAGRVHVLYGMSKDFSANGFRLGALVSQNNRQVLEGLGAVSHFAWPSVLADRAWTAILNDEGFLRRWLATNRQRLGDQYRRATDLLKQHGIRYHNQGWAVSREAAGITGMTDACRGVCVRASERARVRCASV